MGASFAFQSLEVHAEVLVEVLHLRSVRLTAVARLERSLSRVDHCLGSRLLGHSLARLLVDLDLYSVPVGVCEAESLVEHLKVGFQVLEQALVLQVDDLVVRDRVRLVAERHVHIRRRAARNLELGHDCSISTSTVVLLRHIAIASSNKFVYVM